MRILGPDEMKQPPRQLPSGAALVDPESGDKEVGERLVKYFHMDQSNDLATLRPELVANNVSWLHKHLPSPPSSVLDVGCGPGLYAVKLAQMGYEVTGIDVNPAAVITAQAIAKELRVNAIFQQCDFRRLSYSEEFDSAILIYFGLENVPPSEQQQSLQRISASLRPGGTLIAEYRFATSHTDYVRYEMDVAGSPVGDEPHHLIIDQMWYEETREDVVRFARRLEDGTYVTTGFTLWIPTRNQVETMFADVGLKIDEVAEGWSGVTSELSVKLGGITIVASKVPSPVPYR